MENRMYEFNSRVRYSEIGPDKHLTLSGIINYFQDCSTFHSEDIGLGLEYLGRKKRAWILNSWQIIVEKFPYFGDPLTIATWAYEFKGIYGYRNFLLKDGAGRPLACANSIWIYMDTENYKMARITPDAALPYGKEERYPMEYAPRKIKAPEILEESAPFTIAASDLDTNYHVNNAQYIRMAEGYLPKEFQIGQMRAEYRSSAYLGDTVVPKLYEDKDFFTVVLCHADGSIYTIVEFKRKEF